MNCPAARRLLGRTPAMRCASYSRAQYALLQSFGQQMSVVQVSKAASVLHISMPGTLTIKESPGIILGGGVTSGQSALKGSRQTWQARRCWNGRKRQSEAKRMICVNEGYDVVICI